MHNSELADILGNLVNRVVNLIQKNCGGVVPDTQHDPEFSLSFAEGGGGCGHEGLQHQWRSVQAIVYCIYKYALFVAHNVVYPTSLQAVYAFMHFLAAVISGAACGSDHKGLAPRDR